ncbi:MAG: Nif11-like leader peptide family RiPP precursor [Alphaproteobacteria bacterium]|nr:Nif11-like leader peptide family RiPP precursor [Alphaproteobacteria bacterium]
MSQADIERFVSDLKSNAELLGELKSGSTGLASVVEFAAAKGYDISIDEAKAYVREQTKQELSDDQLDSIAGGKGHHSVAVTTKVAVATQAVEAVAAATTAAEAAEVATTAAEAAEVATTVAVVAEGAVVLT